MATRKRSQILEYLARTVLPLITAANGYNNTLKTYERGWKNHTELSDAQFPAVFISETREQRKKETIGPNPIYSCTLDALLIAYVKSTKPNPKAAQTGVQLDLDKLIDDLTKALHVDITCGGLVDVLAVTEIVTDPGDLQPVAGTIMNVQLQYNEGGFAP